MPDPHRCPHCGDMFDAPTFDAHLSLVSRSAASRDIKRWLYDVADLTTELARARSFIGRHQDEIIVLTAQRDALREEIDKLKELYS